MPRMNPDTVCTKRACASRAVTSNKQTDGTYKFVCNAHAENPLSEKKLAARGKPAKKKAA